MDKFSYCPYCGRPLNRDKEDASLRFTCASNHVTYMPYKPCVGAIIVNQEFVLLVKRGCPPFLSHWDIPGGFLNPGEHPEGGLARELYEELGLQIKTSEFLGHFVGTYTDRDIQGQESVEYTLNIFYIVEPEDLDKAKAGDDALEFRWFNIEDLPDNLAFPLNREALEAWRTRCLNLSNYERM